MYLHIKDRIVFMALTNTARTLTFQVTGMSDKVCNIVSRRKK